MVMIVLIGLAAGLASALLFATLATGSALAVVLFYAAPLPILIAAMGWSHLAGLVAALFAAALLALGLDSIFFVAFLAGIGLPAWFIAYLSLLARPDPAVPGGLDWYPVGRIVLWAALVAAAGASLGVLALGTDNESYRAALRTAVEQVLRLQTGTPAGQPLALPGGADPAQVVDLLSAVLPSAAAVLSMAAGLFNAWLAARVVRASGRLARPWPDLAAIGLPHTATIALAAALVLGFLDGLPGVMASLFASTLVFAFALVGLAVAHSLSRGMNARGFVLAALYVAILVFGWPLLVLAVLGLSETTFRLRDRKVRRGGPPAANDR